MDVSLVVVQGKPEGTIVSLRGPQFLIGRDKSCDLRPNSEMVSKKHCGLQIVEDKVIVHDLGSKNGTFVNNERVEESTELRDGDLLRVGPLVFALRLRKGYEGTSTAKQVEDEALDWLDDVHDKTIAGDPQSQTVLDRPDKDKTIRDVPAPKPDSTSCHKK